MGLRVRLEVGVPIDEKQFLHDMASPLTGLLLNMENVTAMLETGNAEDVALAKTMTKYCLSQIQKMTDLIQQRRAILTQEAQFK